LGDDFIADNTVLLCATHIAIVVPYLEARHAIATYPMEFLPVKHAAFALLALAVPTIAAAQQLPWQQQGPQSSQSQGQQPMQQQQMPPSIGYKLSMKPIEACHTAMMSLLKRAQTDPAIRAEQSKTSQPEGDGPEQIAACMRKQAPTSTAFMISNGCSPEDYVKIGLASMEAIMALDVIDHKGKVDSLPPMARENAAFLKANATRLQAIDAEADAAENAAQLTPPGR
jgi:hypothetical protein